MQPIFDVSRDYAPIHKFEVPSRVTALKLTSSSSKGATKRSRSGDATKQAPTSMMMKDANAQAALEHLLLYGDQAEGATARLWRQLTETEKPSRWCSASSSSSSSSPSCAGAPGAETSLFWRKTLPLWRTIMRKCMALLCELVRRDEKAFFLTGGAPAYDLLQQLTRTDGGAAAPDTIEPSAAAPKKGSPPAAVTPNFCFLGLYCLFQALDLELAAVLQVAEEHSTSALPKDAEEAMERLCVCAEYHTDALEDHLIELVLTTGGGGVGSAGSKHAASAKMDFAARMRYFEDMTHILRKAQWPCRLLYTAGGPQLPHAASVPAEEEWRLYHALLPRLEVVGNGSTAVLKRALLDLARADVFHTLDSSVAVLRPAGTTASAASVSNPSEQARLLVRAEAPSFEQFSSRIVAGVYATSGIRRALLEARLLFMHVSQQLSGSEPPPQQQQRQLQKLGAVWEQAVWRHFSHFFEGEDGDGGHLVAQHQKDKMEEPHAYFVRDDGKLSDTQKKALAVMQRLLLVDTEGWFAVPAFDMSNLDFTSISLWIRGHTFAKKTGRAAFDALVQVLERMVDSCVLMYGPTNPFSERVTKIRQQLVDACRREKLF